MNLKQVEEKMNFKKTNKIVLFQGLLCIGIGSNIKLLEEQYFETEEEAKEYALEQLVEQDKLNNYGYFTCEISRADYPQAELEIIRKSNFSYNFKKIESDTDINNN